MLIDLPPLQEYSMADCHDLFLSKMDEDYDVDSCAFSASSKTALDVARAPISLMSDVEPFVYTSSSDSDIDACFSDIELPTSGLPTQMETRSRSFVSTTDRHGENEIALHSPGQLLGTPRDSSRRYEYPFPTRLQGGELAIACDATSSTATTPGLVPGDGSTLGLLPFVAPSDVTCRSASLPLYSHGRAPAPVPVSSPIPIPIGNVNTAASTISGSLAPLAQVPPISGPASAPASGSIMITAHPKLSGFKPADVPVPPGLRGRKRKSASISIPHALQPVASVVVPTTAVQGS